MLVALVVVPVLAAGLIVQDRAWTPMGDDAVILLRVEDVGTSATPLVGAYSTRGWSHPGPAMYFVLAGANVLGGAMALFAGAAALHAAAIVGIGLAAWHRGGLPLVAGAMAATGLLTHGIGADVLIWFWNPHLALLPAVLFVFAAWCVACGDHRWVVPATIVGSLLVQLHVSQVLPVIATAIAAVACTHLDRRGRPTWRQLTMAAAALVVLWAPVAWDQVAGSGNALRIGRYFAGGSGTGIGIGIERGMGLVGRHVAPWGPWAGGAEPASFGNVEPGSALMPVVVLGLLAGLLIACRRRGRRDAGALLTLAVAQLLVAVLAAGRLEEPVLPYVVIWMAPLAMVVWFAIAWALTDLARSRSVVRRSLLRHHRDRIVLVGAGSVALLQLVLLSSAAQGSSWTNPRLPRTEHASAVRVVLRELEPALATSTDLRVEVVGDPIGESGVAIIAALLREGKVVRTSDGAGSGKWGEDRRWERQAVDTTLTIVVGPPEEDPALLERCRASAEHEELATYDRLSPAARAERDELRFIRFVDEAELTADDLIRLEDLDERAYRIAVFSGPDVCA